MKKVILWITVILLAVVIVCHDSVRLPWVLESADVSTSSASDTAQPAAQQSTATRD